VMPTDAATASASATGVPIRSRWQWLSAISTGSGWGRGGGSPRRPLSRATYNRLSPPPAQQQHAVLRSALNARSPAEHGRKPTRDSGALHNPKRLTAVGYSGSRVTIFSADDPTGRTQLATQLVRVDPQDRDPASDLVGTYR
jgi:hypothetical protein